ncbi:MAG: hypothetical protein AB7O52_10010 [Planctomycetota bacterium]
MQITSFLDHWKLRENPFLAEEARQDTVFGRLPESCGHPDFEKILGDLEHPATAIVFGEKGSGKTAIRLQIEAAVRRANQQHPHRRTLLIPYDDLNPILDGFVRRVRARTPDEALQQFRLVDHFDGVLGVAVTQLVAAALGEAGAGVDLGAEARTRLRSMDATTKRDWTILQAVYDRSDRVLERSRALRSTLRLRQPSWVRITRGLALGLWGVMAAVSLIYALFYRADGLGLGWTLAFSALGVLTALASYRALADGWGIFRLARRLSAQLRVADRTPASFRASLEPLPAAALTQGGLPVDDLDDPRYKLVERLLRAVRPFGFARAMVLVDRVDEPTLVSGDAQRMRSIVWPLLNNKFLQQQDVSFKLLLPLELRHELHRQSADFFQSARMDKQNLIDRLTWSGTTLYDLCSVRLNACRQAGAPDISLRDLFHEDVTRQEIVDALDQMRQPRDAFKMMYQLVQEHCRNVTEEESQWEIPKLTLTKVRRAQSDRLEALQRGFGPA